jgi:hypothetical protein
VLRYHIGHGRDVFQDFLIRLPTLVDSISFAIAGVNLAGLLTRQRLIDEPTWVLFERAAHPWPYLVRKIAMRIFVMMEFTLGVGRAFWRSRHHKLQRKRFFWHSRGFIPNHLCGYQAFGRQADQTFPALLICVCVATDKNIVGMEKITTVLATFAVAL